jgi:four helix bundle protein
MKNFRELRIWQQGMEIARLSYALVAAFPKEERFSLSKQITRSAVSIPSNIAEGSSRGSEKDYVRFLEIALGSGFELETQLLVARSAGFGDIDLCEKMLLRLSEEQKMLGAFIQTIKKSQQPPRYVGANCQ